MKNSVLAYLFIFFLLACTSEESKIEVAAIEVARTQMREELVVQTQQRIHGKENLRKVFVDQVIGRTEFEVENIESAESKAKVRLLIRTVPARVQDGVLEIISNLDSSKERAFNVADGIDLVTKKLNLASLVTLNQKRTVFLRKDGHWRAE